MKIGLIGIVNQEMEQDFWGTLQQVAQIGYRGIEAGDKTLDKLDLPAAEIRRRMLSLGIEAIGCHTTKYAFSGKEPDAVVGRIAELGYKHLIMAWGPVESKQQLLDDAKLYNSIGRKCKDAGLQLTYHNHNHEFAVIEGDNTAFDLLMQNTEADLLQAHIDVCWVTFAGVDPVELIGKYAGRIPVLHMKDMLAPEAGASTGNDTRDKTPFTEVGTGIVNIKGCVDAARKAGVQWLVVEQDRLRDLPAMQSIQVSYANLKKLVG